MPRNMLYRAMRRHGTIHGAKPDGRAGGFSSVKNSISSSATPPEPARQKQIQTVVKYKQPSKLARYKQRQVDILVEWNFRLHRMLVELRKNEVQSHFLAYRDELTGLPNRDLLRDRVNQAIPQARRYHKPLAILLLNLDEFTRVNDKLGRAAGDKLLQMVAQRLSAGIRGADTACRYSGDEFVLVLAEIDSPRIVEALAAEVHARLGEPYVIDAHEIHLTVGIGTAVFPDDGQTYEELMKRADAMNRVRDAARSVSIVALPQTLAVSR